MPVTYPGTTGAAGHSGVWTAIVTLAAVDVSDQVVGEIRIEAEEGSARIADLTLKLPAETGFTIADWVGQVLTIDIADVSSGSAAAVSRLFTGVVDTPALAFVQRTVSLRCTDNLQNVLEAMTLVEIDAAIPSSYISPVIFDRAARGWSRAQDRLSTIPAALEFTPAGVLRLTNWAPKEVADLAFTESHVLEESVAVSLASRSQLINLVAIDFGYRFPRVKAEGYTLTFSYVDETSFAAYVTPGNWFLQRRAVEEAIKGAGGTIESISYTPLPNVPIASWVPGQYDSLLCMGFTAVVGFDYAQQIEEQFAITVSAPESIATVGVLTDRLSGALIGEYPPIVAVESSMTLYKNAIIGVPPQDTAPVVAGFTNSAEVTLTADTDRAAAAAAIETLIATAKVRIHGAHRLNSVTAAVALNPSIDLDQTIEISVTGVQARGKCRALTHRLSPDAGTAITEFEIAICAMAGTGVTHPETPTASPDGSEPSVNALTESPTIVFNGGVEEDHTITITFPQVAESERDRATIPIVAAYDAPITEDLFNLTL